MTARLDFMDTARQAFGWIGSIAVAAEGGLAWRDPGIASWLARHHALSAGTTGGPRPIEPFLSWL